MGKNESGVSGVTKQKKANTVCLLTTHASPNLSAGARTGDFSGGYPCISSRHATYKSHILSRLAFSLFIKPYGHDITFFCSAAFVRLTSLLPQRDSLEKSVRFDVRSMPMEGCMSLLIFLCGSLW